MSTSILNQYRKMISKSSKFTKILDKPKPELMPKNMDEFVGQKRVKSILADVINSAKIRKEPLPHILFNANPGFGKTTMAYLISQETNRKLVSIVGSMMRTMFF